MEKLTTKSILRDVVKSLKNSIDKQSFKTQPYVWWSSDESGMGCTPGYVGFVKNLKLSVQNIDNSWEIVVEIVTKSNSYTIEGRHLFFVPIEELDLLEDPNDDIDALTRDEDLEIEIEEVFDLEKWEGNIEMLSFNDDVATQIQSLLESKCIGNECSISSEDESFEGVVDEIEVSVESWEYVNDLVLNINGIDFDLSSLKIKIS